MAATSDAGSSAEKLRGERDALRGQLSALENALPAETAATKLMEHMASGKGVDPFHEPAQNEWVGLDNQPHGCCVVM